jgi:hypothetical protein
MEGTLVGIKNDVWDVVLTLEIEREISCEFQMDLQDETFNK